MMMNATVLEVQNRTLLVYDHNTAQEVLVHTPDYCRYGTGDRVCIQYSGVMTLSIPPQITAIHIKRRPNGRR